MEDAFRMFGGEGEDEPQMRQSHLPPAVIPCIHLERDFRGKDIHYVFTVILCTSNATYRNNRRESLLQFVMCN